MTRSRLLLLFFALVAAISTTLYEARAISRQRTERASLDRQLDDATAQLAKLRVQQSAADRDLQQAEQQLAQLPALPASPSTPADLARDAETKAWLARAKQLHQLSSARSDSQIPELRLLTDEDWLKVASHAAFGTDDELRTTLASLRTAATKKFSLQLINALGRFSRANNNQLPATLPDLLPFLEAPADSAMLQRYELTINPVSTASRTVKNIRQISPVDADYDTRQTTNTNGGVMTSGPGPTTWIDDFQPRATRAMQAYAAAHQGAQPPDVAAAAPYFDPPLDPALLEKLRRGARGK